LWHRVHCSWQPLDRPSNPEGERFATLSGMIAVPRL
jgi:hypothetical protein